MVYVAEGEFRIGRLWNRDARAHTVVLDAFWIDQTEVTNAHYAQCVAAGPALRRPATGERARSRTRRRPNIP
jgi:formylglycine-generating enzyme required for sulfatase activity